MGKQWPWRLPLLGMLEAQPGVFMAALCDDPALIVGTVRTHAGTESPVGVRCQKS